MSYVLTFNDIFSSDYKKVGLIATRLADFFQNAGNVEIGFVLTTDFFNEFMESNNLLTRIKTLLITIDVENTSRLSEIQAQIREMISKAVFSEELKEIIIDSYEGLGIDLENTSTESLVENYEKPVVNIFISSPHKSEFLRNALIMNVKGENQLFKAIKEIIISLYSPELVRLRESLGEEHDIHYSIIIQKMIVPEVSGYAISKNPDDSDDSKVFIASEFGMGGLVDSNLSQDKFLIDKNSLNIISSNVKTKDFSLTIIKETIEKQRLRDVGDEQSLNDKDVIEIARLVKKLKKPIVIFWYILNGKIYCQRIVDLVSKNINIEKKEKPLEVSNYVEDEQEIEYNEQFDLDLKLGITEDEVSLEEDLNVLDQLESEFGFEKTPKKLVAENKDSIINVATEPVPSQEIIMSKEKEFLSKASASASSSIIFLYLAIVNKLKGLYSSLYGAESSNNNFNFLLESVNEQETIENIENLKRIEFYKNEYLSGNNMDLQELREVIQSTLEFIK